MHQTLNVTIFNVSKHTVAAICAACVLMACQPPSLDGIDLSKHFDSIIGPCLSVDYVILGKYRRFDVVYNINFDEYSKYDKYECDSGFSAVYNISEQFSDIYIGNLEEYYYGPDKCKSSPTDIDSEKAFPPIYRGISGSLILEHSCDGVTEISVLGGVFENDYDVTFIDDYTSPETEPYFPQE